MENEPEMVVLKSSRVSFLGNYVLAALVAIFLLLVYISFDLKFSILPKDSTVMMSTILLLGIASVSLALIEQPEWERYRKQFIITMNEVIEHKGIISKEKIILPYATVADIKVEKNILGRLLNYGTLSVSSFKTGSDMIMKGVRRPEKIYVMIQNRVNLIREGQIQMFRKKKDGANENQMDKTELEARKNELLEMIEETKTAFYDREIDEDQFKGTMEKYKQEIIEIDVELKKLKKKR